MIEINEGIPFLWRLSAQDKEGICVVSMVVPFNTGDQSLEHTIETDILSLAAENFDSEDDEILEWNEDDIYLFLKLISKSKKQDLTESGSTIKVDLSDPDTIEIIHIVAAAGFGLAQSADDLLLQEKDLQTTIVFDVGSEISLHTVNGYKRGVIVDMEEDDIVCVMQDEIEINNVFQMEKILPHDVLLVKRHQILDPVYTRISPIESDILH